MQKFENIVTNSKNPFNMVLTLVLLIWSLIGTYMIFNHIDNKIIVCRSFLAVISLVILIYGWGFLGKDYTQSLEYLAHNNPLEFTFRVLIIILTLVIGFLTVDYIVPFFIIAFLFSKIRIFWPGEDSLVGLWKNKRIGRLVLLIILYMLYFSFIIC